MELIKAITTAELRKKIATVRSEKIRKDLEGCLDQAELNYAQHSNSPDVRIKVRANAFRRSRNEIHEDVKKLLQPKYTFSKFNKPY